MTISQKIEVKAGNKELLADGKEIFHVSLPDENICIVGVHADQLFIAASEGCCPPGTVYVLGKYKERDMYKDKYELKEAYGIGLPIQALVPFGQGMLTVAHGCFSGVYFTKRDGTRLDIIDEETYRSLRHHEDKLTYGGHMNPRLDFITDRILLQLGLSERVLDPRRIESYERKERAGRVPFPLVLEHPTDSYQSRGIVEQVDLTGKLESVGVTAQDIKPLEIIYDSIKRGF